MDMMEKVARAIHEDAWPYVVFGEDERCLEVAMQSARAAIAAMREPTEAMRIAALNSGLPEADDPPLYEMIWRNMIDAALTERPSDDR